MPLPIGQGHVLFIEAEAVGLEPTTGISPAPAFEAGSSSGRMTSILSSCGDRNRTCVRAVNSRLPVPARTPPQFISVSVAGFEPTISCARGTRISRLSHTLMIVRGLPQTTLHPAGVEPAHPPWRDGTLPLRHGCLRPGRIVKEQFQSHVARWACIRRTFVIANEKAPGGTRTHVAALRVRSLRLWTTSAHFQWDQTDLNRHLLG